MAKRLDSSTHNPIETRKIPVKDLKRCPVCDTLNSRHAHSCFVCGWHGRFETDPLLLQEGLRDLMLRCPELVDVLAEECAPPPSRWRTLRAWIHAKIRFRRKRLRLDVRV